MDAKAKHLVLDKHKEMASEPALGELPLHRDWVLVKNTKSIRGSKLKPKWDRTPYWMVGQPFPATPVYNLVLKGPCKEVTTSNHAETLRTGW